MQDSLNKGTGYHQQLYTFIIPIYDLIQQFVFNGKMRVCDKSHPLDGLPVLHGHLLESTRQVGMLQLAVLCLNAFIER